MPTVEPGRAIVNAVVIDWPVPTHSSAASTPIPPVSERTASTASAPRASTTSVALPPQRTLPATLGRPRRPLPPHRRETPAPPAGRRPRGGLTRVRSLLAWLPPGRAATAL